VRRTAAKTAKKTKKKALVRKGAAPKAAKRAVRTSRPVHSAAARKPRGPVWQWSAVDTAAAIRGGGISAVEVVEAHLARMRAVNPKLNAVVVDLSEEALRAAHAADKQRAKGAPLGLLHGVPITIKENVDYEGRPNPNGVPANMNIVAPSDSPVVRN
jgi:amidase